MRARDNPFSTDRVLRVRYRLSGEGWESLLARLAALNHRAAIVGPEGAGKTTLLEDLEPHLAAKGFEAVWLRLTREQPAFAPGVLQQLRTLDSRHFILFDGAEQLSRWSWWRFKSATRDVGGLVITSHRHGLLPMVIECRTDAALLASIVSELLSEPVERHQAAAERLFTKHRGNIREALRELYDDWAERATGPAECPLPVADQLPR
jgi:hypothetical protein